MQPTGMGPCPAMRLMGEGTMKMTLTNIDFGSGE